MKERFSIIDFEDLEEIEEWIDVNKVDTKREDT